MKAFLLALLAACSLAAQPPAGTSRFTKETKQLTVVGSAAGKVLAPGRPTALVLEIDLKPKMHVYAPGSERYIGISWQMDASPAVKAGPVKWPKAENLHLDAIGESAQVYTGKLRLAREVTPAAGSSGVTLKGTLRYQACDDRMCYIPVSVPLEWTFPAK